MILSAVMYMNYNSYMKNESVIFFFEICVQMSSHFGKNRKADTYMIHT